MTDHDRLISETIRKNREVITTLILQNQTLSSLLPETKITAAKKPTGYIIDPKTGKKAWYDQKAKARFEKDKRKLTIINKEAVNG